MVEGFIKELSAALVFTNTQDMQPAQAFKLLAMAAIAGVPQVYHSSFSINTNGMVTVTSRIETGNRTVGTLLFDDKHILVHSGIGTYILRNGFQFDKPITLQEARLVESNITDCAFFVHLGGGIYEVTIEGQITCAKLTKHYNSGDIFFKHDNEVCYSTCVTTGMNLAQMVKVVLDPLPARHPTLVRPNKLKIDTPLGSTKSGGDMRRVQALLDKTMADSQAMLESYKKNDEEIPVEGYFGIISMTLVVLVVAGLCAWLLHRHLRKKTYKAVTDDSANGTGRVGTLNTKTK